MKLNENYKKFFPKEEKRNDKELKEQFDSQVTGDLSRLGFREIQLLANLLALWVKQSLSRNAYDVKSQLTSWGFNTSVGSVFLIDEEYNTFMQNGDKLDIFLSLPYANETGFPDEFNGRNESEFRTGDKEYLEKFGSFEGGIFKSKE